MMRPLFFLILSVSALLIWGSIGFAEEVSELERLQDFAQHNRRNTDFDRQRQSGAGEIKKKRREWGEKLQSSVADYKAWKSRQAEALDESSEDYREDQQDKKKFHQELEQSRIDYVKRRNLQRAQKKSTIHLSEEEELGLLPTSERVDISKRNFTGGKGKSASSRGGRGSTDFGNPASDFSNPPPAPPPPVSPPAPEYYEPENQPAVPPVLPPDFEEPIPPPVFDEPADF